jgi:hypothetical protein
MSPFRRSAPRSLAALSAALVLFACSDPSPSAPRTAPAPSGLSPSGPRLEVAPAATQPFTISFAQLSIQFDDDPPSSFTDWGVATVQFIGASDVLYANLVVNGVWQIVNVPLLSPDGPGQPVTTNLNFEIGPDGVPVSALSYAFTLTDLAMERAPGNPVGAPVGQSEMLMTRCVGGGPIGTRARPTTPVKGGVAVDKASQPDFPNQESGTNECGPVATSNSLQWLKKQNNLMNVQDGDISIDAMKKAEAFDPRTGVPLDWYKRKAGFLKEKKIPIATTALNTLDQVLAAMKRGCDIEMTVAGNPMSHLVSVSGITKMKDGTFVLQLKHDLIQGKAGGTVTDNVTWNPRTGVLTGAAWINGRRIGQLVSECYTPPK